MERSLLENQPTSTLLERALTLSRADAESDECWDHIWVLRKRGDVETFEAARSWCDSQDAIERMLAANLLSLLGYDSKIERDGEKVYPFADRSLPMLTKLIDDPDEDVVDAAVCALGHLDLYDPITDRPALANHPSAEMRYAVAYALCGANSQGAINLLIQLSEDEDEDVRDWATFGLGTQSEVDTPEIREALFRRLTDSHDETRAEAMVGLAIRHDSRVIPLIKIALEGDSVWGLHVEAAGEIASAELIELLEALVGWWKVDTPLLNGALKRCKGEPDSEYGHVWQSPANRYA